MSVSPKARYAIGLFLFWTFAGVYGLSYSGLPVTDDEQLFASAALSLAANGDLHAPQLSGNQRLDGVYRGVGPLHPTIGALALQINPFREVGSVQLLFLLPPLYTTLTAILIFQLALRLGYSLRSGILAALFFGLSSMAWPYGKTFFRESLAMLLIVAAWVCFEITVGKHASSAAKLASLGGFGLAFGGLLLTKIQVGVALPVFVWVGLRKARPSLRKSDLVKHLWVVGVVIFLFTILLVKFSLARVLPPGISGRFSLSFLEFAWRRLLSTPHTGFWGAVLGAMFSPGKGFFWYSPISVLAIFSVLLPGTWRKREVYLPWLTFLALLVTQALAYDENWWNITWSTRFLLPALPLMVVAGLPALDDLLGSAKRVYRVIPWALFGGGVLIQLGAVLMSDVTYLARLYQKIGVVYPDPILWRLKYIPLLGHYDMLLEGADWELVLWGTHEGQPAATLTVGLLLAGTSASGLVGLHQALRGKAPKLPASASVVSAALAWIILGSALLHLGRGDPRYHGTREDFGEADEWIVKNARSGDAVVVDAYLTPLWHYLWNFGRSGLPLYSLPERERRAGRVWADSPEEPSNARICQMLNEPPERVWLICEQQCPSWEISQMCARVSLRLLQERQFRDPRSGLQTGIILFEID